MELKKMLSRIGESTKQFKYAIIIVLVGILLMLLPGGGEKKVSSAPSPTTETVDFSEELANILSKISGAGKVSVLLSVDQGEKTIFQANEKSSSGGDTNTIQIDTVVVTDAQRNETGLICQVIPAKYCGAVIVCQGADNPSICLAIVDAVSNLTGLGTDKISVIKMN